MADASPNKIELEIVTPRGRALDVIVDEVTAPGSQGEFGVMPGHLPMLAALRTGIVSYRAAGEHEPKRVAVGAGFAEAGPNKLLILTDEFIEKDKIDPVLVRKAFAEVQGELAEAMGKMPPGGEDGPPRDNPALIVLIARENWLAAQLELYGDPPPAVSRPFELFGPPPPPPENEIPLPGEPGAPGKKG
jgi:F-type H+-transporting ATPase subunit epsilon